MIMSFFIGEFTAFGQDIIMDCMDIKEILNSTHPNQKRIEGFFRKLFGFVILWVGASLMISFNVFMGLFFVLLGIWVFKPVNISKDENDVHVSALWGIIFIILTIVFLVMAYVFEEIGVY